MSNKTFSYWKRYVQMNRINFVNSFRWGVLLLSSEMIGNTSQSMGLTNQNVSRSNENLNTYIHSEDCTTRTGK